MDNFNPLPLDQTNSSDPDSILGQECQVEDINLASRDFPRLSNYMITCVRVKNRSGGTLAARTVVKWATGYFGTGVTTCGNGEVPCGVISPYVGAIASLAHVNMITYGPGQVITNGGGALAIGDYVGSAASGKVDIQTAAPASTTSAMVEVNSRVGRMLAALAATDALTGRAFINTRGN